VVEAENNHIPETADGEVLNVHDHLDTLAVHLDRFVIILCAEGDHQGLKPLDSDPQPRKLTITWSKPSPVRKRAMIGNDDTLKSTEPTRSEARTRLLKAIA